MNLRPATNVRNANIAYAIFATMTWAIAIALWVMFGFVYFIATIAISQIIFYISEYMLYRINPITVLLQWYYCGKHAADTYVLTHIMNS